MGDRSKVFNAATVKDAYPLTNIQENLKKLKGAIMFSSIKACGAYHCVQIVKNSRDCTAFISSFRTIYYIWMPFGFCNAASVYSWMLELAMAYLPAEYWLSYLEGILVYLMDPWGWGLCLSWDIESLQDCVLVEAMIAQDHVLVEGFKVYEIMS